MNSETSNYENRWRVTSVAEHPWKTTLIHLERHFLRECRSEAVSYNSFGVDSATARRTPDGERIWAIYAIGGRSSPPWWQAQFGDTRVAISGMNVVEFDILYTNIHRCVFPLTSQPFLQRAHQGKLINFDKALLSGHDKIEFEVRAAVAEGGWREIYFWHTLTVARMDQRRHEREHLQNPTLR